MGYHTYESYIIGGTLNGVNLNDSTSYNVGGFLATNTATNTYMRVYIPRTGTIRSVYCYWFNATQDSTAENTGFYMRKNDTTDSTGSYTGSFANANAPITFDANLAVTKGDFVFFRLITPVWVTNPQGVYLTWIAEIQC